MSVRLAASVFHDCKIQMRSGEVRPVLADCVQFRPSASSPRRISENMCVVKSHVGQSHPKY